MDSFVETGTKNICEDHARTIVHIDLDCFYAQVEMLKNPALRTQPLGIQQKNIVVTCNYVAREFGVTKCMQIKEAQRLCPKLVLVNGEDLRDYRQTSSKVTAVLQKFSPLVERLGLDENFIDVTNLVNDNLEKNINNDTPQVEGHVYSYQDEDSGCYCECKKRLTIGTKIASDMRASLVNELSLTACAGISYNKLLAKLVCASHKPNQQTVLFPEHVNQFLNSLESIRSIPGIGQRTSEALSSLGLNKVIDVRDFPIEKLKITLGKDTALRVYELCSGRDTAPVKSSGKPQSIGLEDSCKIITVETEIENKFKVLLNRLMELVSEDGRIPQTIKMTVRKFDTKHKVSHREQKQCNISPSLFTSGKNQLSNESQKKILVIVMRLFRKIVDMNKPYHVTLLGLAFTKFQERLSGRSSIASYLMNDVSVQSVTSIQNGCGGEVAGTSRHFRPSSPVPMECSVMTPRRSSRDFNTDGSESEVEPSPKKTKFGKLMARRRCLIQHEGDESSPSKLRVSELRLNSRELERSILSSEDESPATTPLPCPDGVDMTVFRELPDDVQKELVNDWKNKMHQISPVNRNSSNVTNGRQIKNNGILKYFMKKM